MRAFPPALLRLSACHALSPAAACRLCARAPGTLFVPAAEPVAGAVCPRTQDTRCICASTHTTHTHTHARATRDLVPLLGSCSRASVPRHRRPSFPRCTTVRCPSPTTRSRRATSRSSTGATCGRCTRWRRGWTRGGGRRTTASRTSSGRATRTSAPTSSARRSRTAPAEIEPKPCSSASSRICGGAQGRRGRATGRAASG